MATVENVEPVAPGGAFREQAVEADGFVIRYLEGGQRRADRLSPRRRRSPPLPGA